MINLRNSSIAAGALAAGIVLAAAGAAPAASLRGVVVHANKRAHSLVIANARGRLRAVHVARMIAPAFTVTLSVRRLRNGTLAANKVRTGHRAPKVRMRGRVTYVYRARSAFVLSARGASLIVHVHRRATVASAATEATSDGLPALGSEVTVGGTIGRSGDITADSVQNDGQHNNHADLEGVILSIDDVARTITISADDNDELSHASILVHIPSTFDLSSYKVGEVLLLVATLNADGSYSAVDTFDDGGAAANEQDCQQSEDQQGEDECEAQASEEECEAEATDEECESEPSEDESSS
jgi:hypothetical protein